ncbi:MAG: LPD38 domain-containing protein [Luteolibacter sp.]
MASHDDGAPVFKAGPVKGAPLVPVTQTTGIKTEDGRVQSAPASSPMIPDGGALGAMGGTSATRLMQPVRDDRGNQTLADPATSTDKRGIKTVTSTDPVTGMPGKKAVGIDQPAYDDAQKKEAFDQQKNSIALRENAISQHRQHFDPGWKSAKRNFDEASTALKAFNENPKFMRSTFPTNGPVPWVKRDESTGLPKMVDDVDPITKKVLERSKLAQFDPNELVKWQRDRAELLGMHARAKALHDKLLPQDRYINNAEDRVKADKLKLQEQVYRHSLGLPDEDGGAASTLAQAETGIQSPEQQAASEVVELPETSPTPSRGQPSAQQDTSDGSATQAPASMPNTVIQPLVPTDDPNKAAVFAKAFGGLVKPVELATGDSGTGYTFIRRNNQNVGIVEKDKTGNAFVTVSEGQEGDALRKHVNFGTTDGVPVYLKDVQGTASRDTVAEAQYVADVFAAVKASPDAAAANARLNMLRATPDQIAMKVKNGELSVQHAEALTKGIFEISLKADDPLAPSTFGKWLEKSDAATRDRWYAAKTPEAKDAMRQFFLNDYWKENAWRPGVDPEMMDQAHKALIKGRPPEGAVRTFVREFDMNIVPAVATALGGLAAGALAIESGPGAIAADIAGGTAAGVAADAAQRKTLDAINGPGYTAETKSQMAANAKANPTAASFGNMVPTLISILGGGGGQVRSAEGLVLGKAVTKSGERALKEAWEWNKGAARAGIEQMAAKVPRVERMSDLAVKGARAEMSKAAQEKYVQGERDPDGSEISILNRAARGAVTFGTLGVLPEAKVLGAVGLFPAAKELATQSFGRGATDAVAMALSGAIYDSATQGKAPDWKSVAHEITGGIPAFVVQNLVMGALGRGMAGRNLDSGKVDPASAPGSPLPASARAWDRWKGPTVDAEVMKSGEPSKGPEQTSVAGETNPAKVAEMHPNDYARWVASNVDPASDAQILSAHEIQTAEVAITAARTRGDVPTEQHLTAQLQQAEQRADWTIEEISQWKDDATQEDVDGLNDAARSFNASLANVKTRLGIDPGGAAPAKPITGLAGTVTNSDGAGETITPPVNLPEAESNLAGTDSSAKNESLTVGTVVRSEAYKSEGPITITGPIEDGPVGKQYPASVNGRGFNLAVKFIDSVEPSADIKSTSTPSTSPSSNADSTGNETPVAPHSEEISGASVDSAGDSVLTGSTTTAHEEQPKVSGRDDSPIGKQIAFNHPGHGEVTGEVLSIESDGRFRTRIDGLNTIWKAPADSRLIASEADAVAQAAAETDTNPTEAQAEAGNYQKGKVTLHGMPISIENPRGSIRSGTDKGGKSWLVEMPHHYGYFLGTKGSDSEHVDTFIGQNPESAKVFVVNQIDPATRRFDEHKILLGFNTRREAIDGYQASYSKGWKGLGDMVETNVGALKRWLEGGKTTKPARAADFATGNLSVKKQADTDRFKISETKLPDTVKGWIGLREKRRAAEIGIIQREIGLSKEEAETAHSLVVVKNGTGDVWAKNNLTPEQLVKWEDFWEESEYNRADGPVDFWNYDQDFDPENVAGETSVKSLSEDIVSAFTNGIEPGPSDKWVWAVAAAGKLQELGGTKKDVSDALRAQAPRMSGSQNDAHFWYGTRGKEINNLLSMFAPEIPLRGRDKPASGLPDVQSMPARRMESETESIRESPASSDTAAPSIDWRRFPNPPLFKDVFQDHLAGKDAAMIAADRNISNRAAENIVKMVRDYAQKFGVEIPRAEVRHSEASTKSAMTAGAAAQIPVSAIQVGKIGKPVSAPVVIKSMADVLKTVGGTTPLRIGRLSSNKALGEFYVRERLVRIKTANDIPTAAHELGHALQKALFGNGTQTLAHAGASPAAIAELNSMGKALYGSIIPHGGYVSEGFAEWFSVMVYGGDSHAAAAAPLFHQFYKVGIEAKNPDLSKAVKAAQLASETWRNQGDQERARQSVYKRPGVISESVDKAKEAASNFETNWIDSATPIARFVAEATEKGGKPIPMKEDPFATLTALRMAHNARAEYMVDQNMINFAGEKVGKGLHEILAPVRAQKADFLIYLWAKRAVALWNDPAGPRNPGLTEADAAGIIQQLENPTFQRVATDVYKWNDQVLDYAAEASTDYAATVQRIRDRDPGFYIPLFREFDTLDNVQTIGGSAASGKLLDRLRGSGRRIKDPFQGMIAQASALVLKSHQKRVLDQIFTIADTVPDMGNLVMEVPRDRVPGASREMSDLIDQINSKMKAAGTDQIQLTPEQQKLMDEVLTFFTPAYSPAKQGENPILPVFRNGKVHWYEMDEQLYSSLAGMQGYRLPKALDMFLGLPARSFRMGTTGLRAAFSLVTNPLRDFRTLHLNSKASANSAQLLTTWIQEMGHAFIYASTGGHIRPEAIDAFERLGGKMATPLGQDTRPTERAARRLFETTGWRIVDVRNWADFARDILQFPEMASRVTEMRLVGKELGWKPGDPMTEEIALRLLTAAKQVTTDFTAAGKMAQAVNQAVPFFNAGIQGPRAHVRAIKDHPGQFFARALAGTALALALWWKNKDAEWWKELSGREKFGFTYIPFEHDGKKELMRIPRAFEADGMFMAGAESLADAWYQKEPARAGEWLGRWIGGFTQFDSWNGIPVPPMPVLFNETAEQLANRNFYHDTPIVPRSEEEMAPEEQVGPYTSQVAETLGKITGKSPRRIDHAINGVFGGAGTDFAALFGLPNEVPRQKELVDTPVLGTLFVRGGQSRTNSESVEKLYDELEHAGRISNSTKIVETEDQKQLRLMLEDAQKAVTFIDQIQHMEYWTGQRRALDDWKNQIARDAVRNYQNRKIDRSSSAVARDEAKVKLNIKKFEKAQKSK